MFPVQSREPRSRRGGGRTATCDADGDSYETVGRVLPRFVVRHRTRRSRRRGAWSAVEEEEEGGDRAKVRLVPPPLPAPTQDRARRAPCQPSLRSAQTSKAVSPTVLLPAHLLTSRLETVAWARPGVVTDDSPRAGQGEGSNSPFARFSSSISGYIPVRSSVPPSSHLLPRLDSPLHVTQRRPYERGRSVSPPLRTSGDAADEVRDSYFALSRWERFLGFLVCCGGASVCFMIAFFIGLPLLALNPRKFAVSPPPSSPPCDD